VRFEISFYGHENVRSLHPQSIEITTESDLTLNGDCIVGVRASCGCQDIPEKMKSFLRNPQSQVTCTIIVGDSSFTVKGKGDEKMTLTNPSDIVIRKSNFVCPRTLAICCDVASDSILRSMVKALQDPETKGIFRIEVT
jgi:hypothetical protein